MIKVLSIGNSFSQDAHRYLHQIAANEGVELLCEDLVIGGCWLAKHCQNIRENAAAYEWEHNGESTGIHISILDALQKGPWDYVTIQQVSSEAFHKESYVPYAQELTAYIRQHAPGAKVLLHQTWAYEQDSDKLHSVGFENSHEMLAEIQKTCRWVARWIGADGIIPAGEAMQQALDDGLNGIHRDTYHAALGVGRYLLGCLWYQTLTGKELTGGAIKLDEEVSDGDIQIVHHAVQKVLRRYET